MSRKNVRGRKQKRSPVSVWISRSSLTGNFLIMIDTFCFDSAMEESQAKIVAKWVRERLKTYPLPSNFTNQQAVQWTAKHGLFAPDFPSIGFVVQGDKADTVLVSANSVGSEM